MCSGFRMPSCVLQRVALGEAAADELGVDRAVDDDVRHVDVLRPEFARHALRQRAQRMLGAGEGGEVGRAAQRRRGAGEEDRAAPALTIRLATSRPLRKPPKQAISQILKYLRAVSSRMLRRHVGADVEHQHLDRPDVALDLLDQRDHLLFLARIAAEAVGLAARGADAVDQRLQLVGRCAASRRRRSPPREALAAMAPPVASPAPITSATFP